MKDTSSRELSPAVQLRLQWIWWLENDGRERVIVLIGGSDGISLFVISLFLPEMANVCTRYVKRWISTYVIWWYFGYLFTYLVCM